MSELHVATSGPKADEMVSVVLAELDRWTPAVVSAAAGSVVDWLPARKVAEAALYELRVLLDDHLQIPVGLTIASWGVEDA